MGRKEVVIILGVSVVVFGLAAASALGSITLTADSTIIILGHPSTAEEQLNDLIAGELADQVGLGKLDPMCNDLPDLSAGVTFTCTAATTNGQLIEFDGGVESEGIWLEPANVVLAAVVAESFFETYNESYPEDGLTLEGVNCGDGSVVLIAKQMTCTVKAERWALREIATITFHNLSPLEYAWRFA